MPPKKIKGFAALSVFRLFFKDSRRTVSIDLDFQRLRSPDQCPLLGEFRAQSSSFLGVRFESLAAKPE